MGKFSAMEDGLHQTKKMKKQEVRGGWRPAGDVEGRFQNSAGQASVYFGCERLAGKPRMNSITWGLSLGFE